MKNEVMMHRLVPVHIPLSEKEGEQVLKKFGVTKEQLPKIKRSDPVILAIETETGEEIPLGRIIRIVRQSETAGQMDYYRVATD